jgi:hypothetical protein
VKDNEENPKVDDEGNPKEFLTALERSAFNALRDGMEITSDVLLELLNLEFTFDAALNKGYILDIPIEQLAPINWLNMIV